MRVLGTASTKAGFTREVQAKVDAKLTSQDPEEELAGVTALMEFKKRTAAALGTGRGTFGPKHALHSDVAALTARAERLKLMIAKRKAAQAKAEGEAKSASKFDATVSAAESRIRTSLGVVPQKVMDEIRAQAKAGTLSESAIDDLIERAKREAGLPSLRDLSAEVQQAEKDRRTKLERARAAKEKQREDQLRERAIYERNVSRATGMHEKINGKPPTEEEAAQIAEDPVRAIARLESGGKRGEKISRAQAVLETWLGSPLDPKNPKHAKAIERIKSDPDHALEYWKQQLMEKRKAEAAKKKGDDGGELSLEELKRGA